MSLTKVTYAMISATAVNVVDYGADPTGVADSSAAIQAAINASNSVYIPAGEYKCDSQIELKADLLIYGAGVGVTKVHKVTTTYGGVFVANSNSTTAQLANITVRDLTLYDDVATLGFSEQQHLMTFHGVDNVLVDRVEFYGFRGDGLYIGEWNTGTRKRINTNINVTNCLFDGVNKDNRNGISVISGERVTITNNVFQNITRSNMPGAIDFEPDPISVDAVITNIVVSGNRFFNIGGNVGVVAFVIPSTTTKFQNITVNGNTCTTGTSFFHVTHSRSTTESQNISVSNNAAADCIRLYRLLGLCRGVTISANTLVGRFPSICGFTATDVMEDITISDNSLASDGSTSNGGAVISGQANSIVFTGNVFNNWQDTAIQLGINAGDSLSNISIVGNSTRNMRGAAYLAQYVAGTLDGASCVYMSNVGGESNVSRFWQTDDAGGVDNGLTALSFNSATLPDSFRPGTSMAIINGDTGVPDTGGYQGTLVTVRPTINGGRAKYTYQHYYPANNSVKVSSFYMRKRNNAANSWTAWYEFVGV